MNTDKNLWIGLGVVVLVIGAYTLGQSKGALTENSSVATPTTQTEANPVVNNITQQITQDTSANLIASSNNGLACKSIADQAAQLEKQKDGNQNIVVIKTHYSQSLSQCYYELSIITSSGDTDTEIHSAPNDDWVAYCSTSSIGPICNSRNHQGLITEDEFHVLETKYLTN